MRTHTYLSDWLVGIFSDVAVLQDTIAKMETHFPAIPGLVYCFEVTPSHCDQKKILRPWMLAFALESGKRGHVGHEELRQSQEGMRG